MNCAEALALYREYAHRQRPNSAWLRAMRTARRRLGLESKDPHLVHLKAYLNTLLRAFGPDADLDYVNFMAFIHENYPSYQEYYREALGDPSLACAVVLKAIVDTASAETQAEIAKKRPIVLSSSAPSLIRTEANLDHYPDILDPRLSAAPDTNITLGDLHGNAIKLLYSLIREKAIVGIDIADYEELVRLYKKKVTELTATDLERFKEILDKAKAPVKSVLIRLIGDVLCDRGNQDAFTLLILKKIQDLGLKVEVIASNHDSEFIRAYTPPSAEDTILEFGSTSFVKGKDQDRSLVNLQTLLQRIPTFNDELRELVELYYLPTVKLVSHELSLDGSSINIYTHAPVGLETLRALAAYFSVDYKDATARELAATIDAINAAVEIGGGIKAVLDAIPKEGIMNNPVYRIMWNRDYKDLERPAYLGEGKDTICFVHGHDHSLAFPSCPHITNLDDELGKMMAEDDHHRGTYQVLTSKQAKVLSHEKAAPYSSSEDPGSLLHPGSRTPPRTRLSELPAFAMPPAFDLTRSPSPMAGAGDPGFPGTPPRTPSPHFG